MNFEAFGEAAHLVLYLNNPHLQSKSTVSFSLCLSAVLSVHLCDLVCMFVSVVRACMRAYVCACACVRICDVSILLPDNPVLASSYFCMFGHVRILLGQDMMAEPILPKER